MNHSIAKEILKDEINKRVQKMKELQERVNELLLLVEENKLEAQELEEAVKKLSE